MNISYVEIAPITLNWSDWYSWSRLELDARNHPESVVLPNSSGVYEAKLVDSNERLTIGKASNLRMRVRQGLVKGKVPHSSGTRIRTMEDTSKIVIRWAITDRPAAVEEELHKRYVELYGKLPKYTMAT